MTRAMTILSRAVLAAALLSAAGAGADDTTDVVKVKIANMAFSPATLTIHAGTTVTWVNYDGDAHSVESRDKAFPSSPLLNTGDKYSYTFTTPGTYTYYCAVHAYMTGKIVVTEAMKPNGT